MKRTHGFATAASAVMAAGLLVAWLAPASLAQTQIQVLESPGPFSKTLDLGKPGFGTGDEIFEIHDLLDPADTTIVVGQAITRFTVVRLHQHGEDFTLILDCTVRLGEGENVFYGGARFSEFFGPEGAVFPVLGGTGAFSGAAGTVTIGVTAVGGEELALFTFDLITG